MTEQEWLDCADPTPMLRLLHKKTTNRKLRLFVCACCHSFFWKKMPDEARNALHLAECYADDLVTKKELVAARKKLHLNTHYPRESGAVRKARHAAWWATYGRPQAAADAMPRETLAQTRTMTVRGLSARYDGAPTVADLRKVTEIVREVFGNPFHPYPAVRYPPTAVQLATALYNGEDCGYALHDTLLDAGQSNLAQHFREQKRHPKGCWVLDLLLGKE